MSISEVVEQQAIALGDPVPWFSARSLGGGTIDLHVDAGRWIVLAFLGSAAEPHGVETLRLLLDQAALFGEDRMVLRCVLTEPPAEAAALMAMSGPALSFIADYDGALSRCYGALGAPRTIVLDPMLRAIANIPWNHPGGHAEAVAGLLPQLPDVDASAGVPITAPALIVPRIFDFALCDLLVQLFDKMGGDDSGFLFDQNGQTATVVDHRIKSRHDLQIVAPPLRDAMRDQIVRRLLPPIERFFQFRATRMDRYLVSCYDSAQGGHFKRHRDNLNAGAQHRRFAVTINLNNDYDGCDLIFPEFGRRSYRAPVGGAIVFSCGALHEVTPITRGRRYAFVPFLYGEEDAGLRETNNARLLDGEAAYVPGQDCLFPLAAE